MLSKDTGPGHGSLLSEIVALEADVKGKFLFGCGGPLVSGHTETKFKHL